MDTTHEQNTVEVQVMAAVASGDTQAFERLYQIYEKRVFQYVSTYVRDQAVAEEVVVDVMVAVWRGACSFTNTSRVSTWIFGIARHKAIDALRKVIRSEQETMELDNVAHLANPDEGPVESIDRKQVAALTRQAIAKLSREHQEVIRLAFFEDMPYEEIARLLDIPVNTVKTRVYYAKQQLKQQLDRLLSRESVT
jgi:RNA polymerase sigma-70 factor (ECF subfamily)